MNYFNSIPWREALMQLGHCRFMDKNEFSDGTAALKGKKIVIIGCGAQGLNQGLNLRDSGLDVSYALRSEAISEKRASWKNATESGFKVGTYEELIPSADLVGNLTPDKQHTNVIESVMPLMKKGSSLWYSHGFNIVEEGMQIRKDITVVMMAPKGPGSEVRVEYSRGFGIPTLIAVHPENDPEGKGWAIAKALAVGTGGSRAGVLESSFIAEVKSDLMGEQTILCGMLQTGSLLCFDKMVEKGVDKNYAAKFIQYGWETITEALKWGGITGMMDRLANPAKLRAHALSVELKKIMTPLYQKHQDDIISGEFSRVMMEDWKNNDINLLTWREETGKTAFEQTPAGDMSISEQEYFDNGILMAAMVKAGVELAFETMVSAGIKAESAYYESLHEVPLIANLISRKKLYEMNKVISDTAEYGCYLFDNACRPLLADFMKTVDTDIIGKGLAQKDFSVSNQELVRVNEEIRTHPVEIVGKKLRAYMTAMKAVI
ncbi:ketol-acid reductoisomerase [Brucepastera parasyntrophica]|uniref:ketol-acid reductoisomerase n=1 Tax=Brucepastera parasyntrophica TaxID=2880008 RepID=UPI0021088BDE|nr:ketol-acid reductoisomerase [Brucepastera parasyntrophica]ULQ58550.1 ketol-acid reductoisomerase [Brucepastera parasyntrophica]